MEIKIPEGYQHSEAGLIPTNWQAKKLSELFKFKNGVNADKKHYGKGIKFINVLEIIQNNSLFYDDIPGFITLEPEIIKSNLVLKGDVLLNRTSETQEEIGLTAVYLDEKQVVFGGFVIRARPVNDEIDCYFSKYAFSSASVRSQIIRRGQGAVRANIGQSDLKEILIPLPPLPEQKAIAQALSDVDVAIAELDRLITKKRNIKQGTTQQLLTGKKRLPGFSVNEVNTVTGINAPKGYKQTEVGLIPVDWEVKQLGKIGIVSSGGTPNRGNSSYWNGNIPWITTTQIDFNTITYANEFITEIGLHNSSAKKYSRNTLLMAMYGQGKTRGKVAILGIDATINQACAAIILNKDVYNKYVFFYLAHNYEEIRKLSNTGNQENLNGNIIKSIFVPIPPFSEQEAIAQVLSDMDAEIEALEQKRDKYKAIKQGMMQELLTGRTRLI